MKGKNVFVITVNMSFSFCIKYFLNLFETLSFFFYLPLCLIEFLGKMNFINNRQPLPVAFFQESS